MKRKVCMDTHRVIQCSASGVGVAVHRTPVDRTPVDRTTIATTAISSSTTCCTDCTR